jgi:hypothetical protein
VQNTACVFVLLCGETNSGCEASTRGVYCNWRMNSVAAEAHEECNV